MVLSMAIFAVEDMFIKQASAYFPTGQIITLLGLGGAMIFALWSALRREAPLPSTLFRGAALLRSIFEAFATLCFTMALALVPLALFTTVMQANPLLVTLGAALIFGHQVGWRRWSAIAIGLAGVLIVLRPFGSSFELTALWVVGGVILQAGRDLITSRVSRTITTLQISTAAFAALIPTGIIVALVSGTPFVCPELEGWLRLGGAIGTGIPAIYAIILANRIGDVSFVAPFRYSRIVFGLALSVIVFGEVLDGYTLIGAAIIVASGLYTFAREARLRRTSPSAKATL
ncbi:MAG: DMT family transporter [Rhodobacteraceae bacterium]|jgi:drug/metabolite transporter (DMT)-like permease|nr:DMT family transporter [Paracoccaceae bacterium]